MRLAPIVSCAGLVALFSACNAILGNESEYELVASAGAGAGGRTGGTAGNTSGGKGGAAGSSMNSGGRSSGAGNAGSANAGRGGTSAGDAGETGNAGGDDAGDGGTGELAGASGEAGAPGCVMGGVEDCFNGVDDDCNGDIDCSDSACSGPAECRPAPSGDALGHFAVAGAPCEDGFTELELHRDLTVPFQCNGCACVSPTNLLCDSGLYQHASKPCPSYEWEGLLYTVFNDRCTTMPAENDFHYYSIRGTSECTATGTPALEPATWAESTIFCLADRVGGGCGSGQACLPKEAPSLCTLGSGGCDADYADDRGTWYEGFEDERSCSDCSCGLGTADCTASYIGVYSDGGCGTNPMALASVPDQGDVCSLPFQATSARIIGNPVPGSGSCQVNSFMSGEATPTNDHRVCCAL